MLLSYKLTPWQEVNNSVVLRPEKRETVVNLCYPEKRESVVNLWYPEKRESVVKRLKLKQ